jgi:hypothetical protein
MVWEPSEAHEQTEDCHLESSQVLLSVSRDQATHFLHDVVYCLFSQVSRLNLLNIRLFLSQRVHKLAAWLRYVDIPSLGRTFYWRSSALFRADPNPWTWALYHIADQLWDRISVNHGWRGLRRAHALWEICAWLERGYEYSETPCFHCGWAWGQGIGDARASHECECWIANFEAEHDQVEDWLEQERQHRDTIAGDEGGATHLLVGGPGGPIPVRRIHLGLREESA